MVLNNEQEWMGKEAYVALLPSTTSTLYQWTEENHEKFQSG